MNETKELFEKCLSTDHNARKKALVKLGEHMYRSKLDPADKQAFMMWVAESPERMQLAAKVLQEWDEYVQKGYDQVERLARNKSITFKVGDQAELGRYLAYVLTKESGGEKPIYCEELTYVYNSDTGSWVSYDSDDILNRISGMNNIVVAGTNGKYRPLGINMSSAKGAMGFFQSRMRKSSEAFLDTTGLSFKNGFVGLDGMLQPHAPGHYSRFHVAAEYDSSASSSVFNEFLRSFFVTDVEDKVTFIKEYIGACLLGIGTYDERVLLLKGSGKNGKSTLIKCVESLFPKEFRAALPPKRWDNRFDLTQLVNKRLNSAAELPGADAIKASDTFKNVTAGDSCTAEIKYGAFFSFVPVCGHIFSANKLSDVSDDVAGFWRRFVVIELERYFLSNNEIANWRATKLSHLTEQEFKDLVLPKDSKIQKRLAGEKHHIINECVAAFLNAYKNNEYTIPVSSDDIIARWRLDTVSHLRYLTEEWNYSPKCDRADWVKRTELYSAYKKWVVDSGNYALSANKFYRALEENYGIDPTAKDAGGNRVLPFIRVSKQLTTGFKRVGEV